MSKRVTCALCAWVLLQVPLRAHAICRVVEPLGQSGGVAFDPTTLVLYVLAPDQPLGRACEDDAFPRPGSKPHPNMSESGDDGGTDEDAGFDDEDGGRSQSGPAAPTADASVADAGALPLCPVGMHPVDKRGSLVHMVVQPAVLSTGRAGLIMPVPARPDVHAANPDLFNAIGGRLQPRKVTHKTYVEDESLGYQCNDPKFGRSGGDGCGDDDVDDYDYGPSGGLDSGLYDPDTENGELQRVMIGDGEVSFEQALTTRDYDVTVLSASSPMALRAWLDEHELAHDSDDDAAFAAYVSGGAWFVALDVHPQGFRTLDPLVVSFPSDRIPIMHRLQYDPAGGELTTDVFVMAQSRVRAADYSAETLYAAPVGFGGAIAGFGLRAGWITQLRLTRQTDEQLPDSEIVFDANDELRPELVTELRVRIPSSKCPRSSDSGGGGCLCSLEPHRDNRYGATLGPSLLALLWIGIRGHRRRRRQS